MRISAAARAWRPGSGLAEIAAVVTAPSARIASCGASVGGAGWKHSFDEVGESVTDSMETLHVFDSLTVLRTRAGVFDQEPGKAAGTPTVGGAVEDGRGGIGRPLTGPPVLTKACQTLGSPGAEPKGPSPSA